MMIHNTVRKSLNISSHLDLLLQCWLIRRMDILMNMSMNGMAPTDVILNISLGDYTNVTNITFSPYYQHSLFVATIYILAYFFIFLLCMVGNILVCCLVMENRRMRTVINLFIFNLAVSDILVGIFCIPTTLVDNLITGESSLGEYLLLFALSWL